MVFVYDSKTKKVLPGWTIQWLVNNKPSGSSPTLNIKNVKPTKERTVNVTVVATWPKVGKRQKTMIFSVPKGTLRNFFLEFN